MSYYNDAGIDPASDNEEKEDPPASPPSPYSYVVSEIFTDEDILADLQFDPRESNDQEDEIGKTFGQHQFDKTFYRNHSESSIVDIEGEGIWCSGEIEQHQFLKKRKRSLFCSCALLLKLIVVALGWATLSSHWNSKSRNENGISTSQSEMNSFVTVNPIGPAPTAAPTVDPTEPPTSCVDEVVVPKSCYTSREPIRLHFHYCTPDRKNWLGLYREGSSDQNGTMIQRSLYWQLSCGGHGDSCVSPREYGTITMTPTLGIGTYQVYGMGNMDRPHISKAVSETFDIRMRCE